MSDIARRGAREGIAFGLIAGILFAAAEIVASVLHGGSPLMPIRMFASILAGSAALNTGLLGTTVLWGGLIHIGLSVCFGLIYGLINARLSTETETRWGRQAWLGLTYGAMLWLVNFQIIGRYLFPWFLTTAPFLQMVLHAVFYGLPLALMYAAAERRAQMIFTAAPKRT